jgi:asparagine synthase (glutamine-hydrolysing)
MGDTGRSDDYEYAKRSVEHLGLPAETVVLDYDDNTFERFLKICWHHEKPFPLNGNAMAMPQMYEAIESEGIPVVLDGSGGDEIFGGYWERHMPFAMRDALQHQDWQWIKQVLSSNGKSNQVRHSLINAFLPASFINMKRKVSSRFTKQLHPLINASSSEIWNTVNPDPLTTMSSDFSRALSMDVAPGGRLGEWIWHNDRNSMMSSVESRSPLLDYRLHKFLFTGYSNKYQGIWNKYELRKIFDQFQPLPTQWRSQKQGFRWDGKHFILNNKDRIIELIASSDCLSEVLDTKRLVALARKYPKILRSSLGNRALCVAGIEQSLIRE